MIWVTIDVEEVTDMNFHIEWKKRPNLNYEQYINYFIEFSQGFPSTAFVLGSFAKRYPKIVKNLFKNGIEIASHGYYHKLVYQQSFKEWREELTDAKKLLEDLVGSEIKGYRSPSWSMPFEKRYYATLIELGFSYSSSYFPFKTYMYGHSEDKKEPFVITTDKGVIEERPIAKYIIPFSGGFYLRVLPLWLLKFLFHKVKHPTLYIHPYELMDENLLFCFRKYAKLNVDYFLAFYRWGKPREKIIEILNDQ